MPHLDKISKIQSSGISGQDLVKGFLGKFLRISEYNGDVEGADVLCESPFGNSRMSVSA